MNSICSSTDRESIDQLRRQVETMGAALPALPLQPITPSPSHSSIASIEPPGHQTSHSPHLRPQLKPPEHFMYGLIRTHHELEKTVDKQTRIFHMQVNRDMEEIDRLEAEKAEKISQHAETLKSQKTWDLLSSAAQYIAAGTSTVLGIACISTGVATPVGVMLIASGVVGVTGRVMHDTGAFESIAAWFTKSVELQKKIANRMEMGMFFLSLGLGLASGFSAYHLGVLSVTQGISAIQKTAAGISIATSLGKGSIDLKTSFVKRKNSQEEASLHTMNTEISRLFQEIHESYKETQAFIDTAANIGQELKQAISASVIHQD